MHHSKPPRTSLSDERGMAADGSQGSTNIHFPPMKHWEREGFET